MARKPTNRPETFRNSMTGILREVLNKRGEQDREAKVEIAEKLVDMAKNGDLGAIKYIFDRIEPITQSIDVNVDGKMKAVVYLPQPKELFEKKKLVEKNKE